MKRVLQVVSALNAGGAETMIMNIYRNIDKSRVQFDFIVFGQQEAFYEKEVRNLGGNIFRVAPIRQKGIINFVIGIIKIIKANGPYIAVHSHIDYLSGLVALASRIANVDTRICHSHNASALTYKGELNKSYLKLVRKLIVSNATNLLACSKNAASYMFGCKYLDNTRILNNAINVDEFNKELTIKEYEDFYKEFNIETNSKIIGHIGRFVPQKNHKKLLEIYKEILRDDDNVVLLLIGDGPLKSDIENYATELCLDKKVRFLGLRSDIKDLIKIFDILLLPSLFEGLPVTLIEAQAAGIKSVVSDGVSKEVDLGLNLIKFISLEEKDVFWANEILDFINKETVNLEDAKEAIIKNGFDINKNIELIYELYGV